MMLTWLARKTGPGSVARWAANAFNILRTPENAGLSNLEIFRLMLAARYALIPHRKAEAFFENYFLFESAHKIGLFSLVLAILQAEHGWDSFSIPQSFREAVWLELSKSGLPLDVITDSRIESQASKSEKLLVVEDDGDLLQALGTAFCKHGFEVILASNAYHDGLTAVHAGKLSGIVCDWVMPGMSGDDFYLKVMSIKPELCDRFIFITGNTPETALGTHIQQFVRVANARILYKPFAFDELLDLVQR